MIDWEYDAWIKKHSLRVGDIVEFFNSDSGTGEIYGMVMIYNKTPVLIYKDGFDYLSDVFNEIRHIYRPEHPAYYSPWQWGDIKNRVKPFYTANTRYVSKEDLEEELGYKIELI